MWVLYIFWRLNPCPRYHWQICFPLWLVPFSFVFVSILVYLIRESYNSVMRSLKWTKYKRQREDWGRLTEHEARKIVYDRSLKGLHLLTINLYSKIQSSILKWVTKIYLVNHQQQKIGKQEWRTKQVRQIENIQYNGWPNANHVNDYFTWKWSTPCKEKNIVKLD